MPAAAARGITVTYVPDYCLREVSDHAMAMLLALARKIPFANKLVQSGRWELPPIVPLRRLEGQVLGLIGFGNIPRAVVPKAQGVWPHRDRARSICIEGGVRIARRRRREPRRSLVRSDFISVHAPLTPATRGLVNAAAFAKMKKGALIVNTARGPLIDEPALIAALDSGHLGGAALDVVDD